MDHALTDITMILDRSGSMSTIADDVVLAIRDFITEQQSAPGRALFTMVQFDSDDPFEVVYEAVDMQDARPPKGYTPRASTPLLDAVGHGIVRTGQRLAAMPEADRPGKVVFVILTDGLENASSEYSPQLIREMIRQQESVYSWHFVFLAADRAAFEQAAQVGFNPHSTAHVKHSGRGIRFAMARSARNISGYRSSGNARDLDFTPEDREKMQEPTRQ